MELRQDRPSYVMFERKPIEDRTESLRAGSYRTKDEDFAIITPIGSKDRIFRVAKEWFDQLKQQVTEGRVPQGHYDQYWGAFQAWKRNEEPPVNGIPIKGWQLASPAQQTNILASDIRTVEDLAQANDEALKRIGMGSLELRDKAKAWLKEAATKGSVAGENAGLHAKLRTAENSVKALQDQVQEMKLEMEVLQSRLATETN